LIQVRKNANVQQIELPGEEFSVSPHHNVQREIALSPKDQIQISVSAGTPPKGKTPSPTPKAKSKSPSPEAPARYQAYRVEYAGRPNHEALFVETHEESDKTGHVYHVTGNILRGMTYEHKWGRKPEASGSFVAKHSIGTISAADYFAVEEICRSIAVPGAQLTLGGNKTNPNQPIRRCGEWTSDAIHQLRARGVLKN
jgi:hypothetical protein